MQNAKIFSTFLVALTLISPLLTSQYFVYANLTSYFLFSLLSRIALIYSLILLVRRFRYLTFKWNAVVVIFLLWTTYVFINAFWLNKQSANLKTELILDSFLFFIALKILRSLNQLNFSMIARYLTVAMLVESSVCMLQWLGVVKSLNSDFTVTGTQVNPNITAMFLALGTSFLWSEVLKEKIQNNRLVIITFLATIISMFLLECRSAIIGIFVIALIFLNKKYNLLYFFRSEKNRSKAVAFTILLICGSGLAGKWMYEHKQASADGRVEIWKTSLQMIQENLLTGSGYGLFERNYNLYRAEHLNEDDKSFTSGSSFARIAYNEVLENAVEGGLTGAILFLLLGVSSGYCYFKFFRHDRYEALAAFAGVVAFFTMSLVNFTLQAIPVFALFVFFLASLTPLGFVISDKKRVKGLWMPKVTFAGFFFIAGVFFYTTVRLIDAFRDHKKAVELLKQRKTDGALALFRPLKETLETCESYYTQYGRALFAAGQYKEAMMMFQQATELTSHPDVYLNLGFCHQQSGDFQKAEENFKQALQIMPERFLPRYALMELNIKANRNEEALTWAQAIANLSPKIPSREVDFYKSKAEIFIRQNTN